MKFAKSLVSHTIEGIITFLAVVFAMGSLFWFDSAGMKLAGCIGAMIAGYILSYLAAKIRGG